MGSVVRFIVYITALVFIAVGIDVLLFDKRVAVPIITVGILQLVFVGFHGVRIAFMKGIFAADEKE